MMTPERWQKVKEVLGQALEMDPVQRTAYLGQACGSDLSLREEIERLLAVEKAGPDFLSRVAPLAGVGGDSREDKDRRIGQVLGSYRIVSAIGEGGMGAVYRGIRADDQYHKEVAIKLVHAGQDSPFVVSRFKNERQILAGLDHPNIARLLDGGTTADGIPYFVMELIEGQPIDGYCDHRKLTIDARLRLFLEVCSAVQYAHRRLIVHRDIKPSNILVTTDGVPKLLDFGIAKILDAGVSEGADLTMSLRVLTPAYASPEQVRGEPITTASDMYSLGVVLYEILTGRQPYRVPTRTPEAFSRAICEHEPEKPSAAVRRIEISAKDWEATPDAVSAVREGSPEKLRRRLAGDLDKIVLMALRKEPERRYSSVDQFAEDVRRHLKDLPVVARGDALGYRARKFASRHKAGISAAVLATLALIVGLAMTLREARIAQAERARAERRFNDVRKLANSLIFEIHDSVQGLPGATSTRKLLLDRALEYLDGLSKESNGDDSLQRELATAYQRIGALQGNASDANLGDSENGLNSLRKALAIWGTVAKNNPGNVADQLSAATGHRMLAFMLGTMGRPGAREQIDQALEMTARLLRMDPTNAKVRRERSIEYDIVSGFQEDAGDPRGAVESLRNGMAIGEDLARENPSDVRLQGGLAMGPVKIGNELALLGSRQEALRANGEGLKRYEALASNPTNARSRREMAVSLAFRGNIQMMDGDAAGALESFRRSLAVLEPMENADPQNAMLRLDVAGASAEVGRALAATGKLAEGKALLDRAIQIFQESRKRDSSNEDIPQVLGQAQLWKGEALARGGDTNGALRSFQEGLASFELLAAAGPPSLNTKSELAVAYVKIGNALATKGEQQKASDAYRKAAAMVEPLISGKSSYVPALYAAADAYFGMGNLAERSARRSAARQRPQLLAEARSWYQKSVKTWEQIPEPGIVSPNGYECGSPRQAGLAFGHSETALGQSSPTPDPARQ